METARPYCISFLFVALIPPCKLSRSRVYSCLDAHWLHPLRCDLLLKYIPGGTNFKASFKGGSFFPVDIYVRTGSATSRAFLRNTFSPFLRQQEPQPQTRSTSLPREVVPQKFCGSRTSVSFIPYTSRVLERLTVRDHWLDTFFGYQIQVCFSPVIDNARKSHPVPQDTSIHGSCHHTSGQLNS